MDKNDDSRETRTRNEWQGGRKRVRVGREEEEGKAKEVFSPPFFFLRLQSPPGLGLGPRPAQPFCRQLTRGKTVLLLLVDV